MQQQATCMLYDRTTKAELAKMKHQIKKSHDASQRKQRQHTTKTAEFGIQKGVQVRDGVYRASIGSLALEVFDAHGGGGAGEARVIAAHGVGERGAGVLQEA